MILAVRGGSLEPEIPFLEAWFRRLVSPIMDKRDIMVRDPVPKLDYYDNSWMRYITD